MGVILSIDYLAVIVASVTSFIFGWLWYGPFFGKVWAKENKVKMGGKPEMNKMLLHFLTTLLLVLFFSMLFAGSMANGILFAFIAWVAFFLSTRLGSMIWMKQSWKLFGVDMSYNLLNLILIVVILSLV